MQNGDIFDRYRLDERLGAGAFGEVWRASQLADGEDVGVACAVKIMKVTADRAGSTARALATGWLDEVRNLVRVAGESIPRIFEANVWNDHAYIAMELLAGSPLSARIAQGAIPWRRALFIADQIALALETAHQVGIVHRDLKPQNVMLVGSRRACVIDWGIASLNASTTMPPSGVARREVVDVDATDAAAVAPILAPKQRPMVMGTPGYIAPEIYEGAAPAPEQDVFALGVVLYEMLAGCLPHKVERFDRSRSHSDTIRAYRGALARAPMDFTFVPLAERVPDVPPGVAELVDALLARNPEDRPRELRKLVERASRFPERVPDPPYAGLVKLGPERAGLYFGQQDAIQHVLERLRPQRAALLWGPSGSGKSSLALAGVAATIDRTLFLDTDGWAIHVVRPREHSIKVTDQAAPASTLGQIVVVDQLEEVVDLSPADQETFCSSVLALLDGSAPVMVRDAVIAPGDHTRLVATIRDDLEWRVDREVPALRPLLERRIIVKGVDANFAKSIIQEPARAHGYDVEGIDGVSREVEERLSADPAKLPVVQYALTEWWERRDKDRKVLPIAAWRELGGVDGALSFVAEKFYSSLDADKQAALKRLLTQMFLGGRKQPLVESTLAPDVKELLADLTRLRLVGRRDKKGSAPFYEVEHESLALNWTRLAGWLSEAREDRALFEELERDATAYERDHEHERLWKKGRLAAALDIAGSGRVMVSDSARSFLDQARRQERRARLIRVTSLVVGLTLVLGVVYAVVLNNAASGERDRAVEQLHAANLDRERTSAARAETEKELAAAQAKRHEAEQKLQDLERETTAATQAKNDALLQRDAAVKREQAAAALEKRVRAICGGGSF